MSVVNSTYTTSARWQASPVRDPSNPKPPPPVFDPTRRPPSPPASRRGLLSSAAAAVLGVVLASCVPPGAAQPLPDQFPAHGGRAAALSLDAGLIALCAQYLASKPGHAAEWFELLRAPSTR